MQRTEWILFLTVLLAVAGFALPTPVITPMFMAQDGGLLAADAGQTERVWWLMGCFALYPLGQMLGSPWLGRLSDRFGRRPVLSAALMGVVFSYVLMAVAIWWQWLWLLLAARLLSGLCNGTVAIAQALAADISAPARKPVLFSRLNIALNMGWIIGPLAGGLLAEQTGDYAMPFLIAGVVALLNLAGVSWGLPEQPRSRVVEAAQVKAVSLWQVPQMRLYLVLTLLSYGAIMLYFNFFNVLVEAARIARGEVLDLAQANADDYDALIIPGGFGAAKNLCDFAVNGSNCTLNPDVQRFTQAIHGAGKPVGLICIAPAMTPLLFGQGTTCTIGSDADVAAAIETMGGHHQACAVNEIVIDREKKVVTTPAYMLAGSVLEAASGIDKLVTEVLALS